MSNRKELARKETKKVELRTAVDQAILWAALSARRNHSDPEFVKRAARGIAEVRRLIEEL